MGRNRNEITEKARQKLRSKREISELDQEIQEEGIIHRMKKIRNTSELEQELHRECDKLNKVEEKQSMIKKIRNRTERKETVIQKLLNIRDTSELDQGPQEENDKICKMEDKH